MILENKSTGNAQILIIEDEGIVAKDIKYTLERLGYTVPAVIASGEHALEAVANIQPDLMLVDIKLRGEMNGIQTVEQIRARFDIPVVYLTAFADEDMLQRAKVTEPFGYIIKPFEGRELHSTIEMALYKHKVEKKLRENERSLKQRNRELAMLNQARQSLTAKLNSEEVYRTVLDEVRNLLNAPVSSIWLIDQDIKSPTLPSKKLVCKQASGPQSDIVRGWQLPWDKGLVGWVASHSKSLIVADADLDARHFKGVDQKTGLMLRSILSVPLKIKQEVMGVLQVLHTEANRFNQTDLTLLESLAATAAIAIENAKLYEQAQRDAQTKDALLKEVNHRVKNNLAGIIGLLHVEQRYASKLSQSEEKCQASYQTFVQDLTSRLQGLSKVHDLLTAVEWGPLPLDRLTQQVIKTSLHTLPHGKSIAVNITPSPVHVTAKQANDLALFINELTTNTIKYALKDRPRGRIDVSITLEDGQDMVRFEFRDDGPGYPEDVLRMERHNAGVYLMRTLTERGLRGTLTLDNNQGAVITLKFKTEVPSEDQNLRQEKK